MDNPGQVDDVPGGGGPGAPPELPYIELSEERYAAAAAAFQREISGRATLVLSGPCPRCSHVMEYLISETALKGPSRPKPTTEPATAVASVAAEPEYMCCTCEQAHPGRPATYLGCGAYWPLPSA